MTDEKKFFSPKSLQMWLTIGGVLAFITGAGFLNVISIFISVVNLPQTTKQVESIRMGQVKDSISRVWQRKHTNDELEQDSIDIVILKRRK